MITTNNTNPFNLKALRVANVRRQKEWPGNDQADTAFRTIEVCGEIGEVAEAFVNHFSDGLSINESASLNEISSEIADVVITIDLLASNLEIDLEQAFKDKCEATKLVYLNDWSDDYRADVVFRALVVCASIGKVVEAVKKLLRSKRDIAGNGGNVERIAWQMVDAIVSIDSLSSKLDISLNQAIKDKFNHTSIKYGFETRL